MIAADVVVVSAENAGGGSESNPEMRQRYLGPGWDFVKVRGTPFNMGTMPTKAFRRVCSGHEWSTK